MTTDHLPARQPSLMAKEQLPSNQMVSDDDGWDGYNVIAVSFDDDRNAYDALTLLKQLDSQRQVGLQEAVVVIRDEDGRVVQKDKVQSPVLVSTAGGGLLGLLIGIIGGPFGMLIGGVSGLVAGSLFDLYDIDKTDSALAQISTSVRVGHTALLAVVTEQSPEVVDAAMAGVGGTVLRRSVADVEAEIAVAEQAEREAKREARRELLRGRREHHQAAISAKIEELKAKVRHDQNAPAAGDKAPTGAAAGGSGG